ncbi:MAG: putative signal transducing protein [Candidatus Latescibacterota bacterium]
MKTVATFGDTFEANIAKSKLEDEGIPAMIADEHVTNLLAYYPANEGARLQVLDEDYDRAREILGFAPLEAEKPPCEKSADACPQCGSTAFSTRGSFLEFLTALFGGVRTKRMCRKCGGKW